MRINVASSPASMFKTRVIPLVVMPLVLQVCTTIIESTSETIAINSEPAGARCRVIRESAVLANVTTPATVEVDKELIDDRGQPAKRDALNHA